MGRHRRHRFAGPKAGHSGLHRRQGAVLRVGLRRAADSSFHLERAFVLRHDLAVTALTLATVFQLAHLLKKAAFPCQIRQPAGWKTSGPSIKSKKRRMDFARNNSSSPGSWAPEFPVEHHLFPASAHIHYPGWFGWWIKLQEIRACATTPTLPSSGRGVTFPWLDRWAGLKRPRIELVDDFIDVTANRRWSSELIVWITHRVGTSKRCMFALGLKTFGLR